MPYIGVCWVCKKYGELTFRYTRRIVDDETGEVIKKGKRFPICLNCVST